jgi:nitrogen fixation protein NifU and related proteins
MSHELYAENIVDHYKNPRNKGNIDNPDIHNHEYNPLCGDELDVFIKLDGDIIKEIKFNGQGCAISQASASMLMEYVEGRTIEDAKKITRDDILEMLGIEIGVVRMKCALLSLSALHGGVFAREGSKNVIGNQ